MSKPGFHISISSGEVRHINVTNANQHEEVDVRPLISCARDQVTDRFAVCIGRLMYRRELTDEVASSASDAEVLLALFDQVGVDGFRRLEGDFAFALYDSSDRILYAGRDCGGNWPLFWTRNGQSIDLATGLRVLAPEFSDSRINKEYLADYLMCPFGVRRGAR